MALAFILVTQRWTGYSPYSKRVHIRIWQFLLNTKIVFFSGYKMYSYWEKNREKYKQNKNHQILSTWQSIPNILTYLCVMFVCV